MTLPTRPLAVVTGASKGIGRELAGEFARGGFDLVIAAEDSGIADAGRDLERMDIAVTAVRVDLATYDGVEELHEAVQTAARPPDALAVNAARQGFQALMAGKDHVVAGEMKNKAQAVAARFLPETTKAKTQAGMTEPGSAEDEGEQR